MYSLTKNIVLLQKNQVWFKDAGVDNRSIAVTVQAELMRFGYMLDQEAFQQMGKADKADIVDFHNEVINYLRYMTGGNRDYKPFYPGFPEQVMQMTERELWINQFTYYWSNCKFEPAPWTEPFKAAFETVKYKMLTAGSVESFNKIFTDLVSVNQSLTPQDLDVIKWYVSTKQQLVFPDAIPFKENLCTLAAMGLDVPVKTTTDVLRIAVHLSGGDISLPAVPKKQVSTRVRNGWRASIVKIDNPERKKFEFKKFKRAERRYILGLLEKSNCDTRDMVLKDQRWVRLGEILHPGEYAKEFPRAYRAFQAIRETKVVSWYGAVSAAFKTSFQAGINKLAERPGEFLRRLDYLLRTNGAKQRDIILKAFYEIAVGASNKVLFEVFTHFEGRKLPVKNRSIFIKGARKKTPLPDLPPLAEEVITAVQDTIFQALKAKFALLEKMGDCWIDPELKKIPLPTNMRSLSESLVPTIRGQRLPMAQEKKVVRPFIHWYDQRGTEDIDLHGFLLGKSGSVSLGFNGIHNSALGCYSGDVRHRQGACAEYVDINVAEAQRQGYNYFVMVAHNFNGRPFSSLKDCVVGVMERDSAVSGSRAWLPDTITNCFRPTSSARMALIGVYDLNTREYIHLDLDWGTFNGYVSGYNSSALFDAIAPFIEPPKYSVYDLLSWHVEARGRLVQKEMADTHFLYDDFSASYVETLKYMGI